MSHHQSEYGHLGRGKINAASYTLVPGIAVITAGPYLANIVKTHNADLPFFKRCRSLGGEASSLDQSVKTSTGRLLK